MKPLLFWVFKILMVRECLDIELTLLFQIEIKNLYEIQHPDSLR